MANSNIPSLGRFSSQMLTYLGTQRTVKTSTGSPVNTYKYANGPTVFPNPGSTSQAVLGGGVVGNYSPTAYNTTKCYFLARGVSEMYADTMTALAIDIAALMGISTQTLLEKSSVGNEFTFSPAGYRAFNLLRDPGNQVGVVTSVSNKYSLQARAIRS